MSVSDYLELRLHRLEDRVVELEQLVRVLTQASSGGVQECVCSKDEVDLTSH